MTLEAVLMVLAITAQIEEGGNLVWEVLQHGGPASVAFFALVAWYFERRDHRAERDSNREIQQKVIDMAMAQVEQAAKSEAAIRSLTDVLNRVDQRLT